MCKCEQIQACVQTAACLHIPDWQMHVCACDCMRVCLCVSTTWTALAGGAWSQLGPQVPAGLHGRGAELGDQGVGARANTAHTGRCPHCRLGPRLCGSNRIEAFAPMRQRERQTVPRKEPHAVRLSGECKRDNAAGVPQKQSLEQRPKASCPGKPESGQTGKGTLRCCPDTPCCCSEHTPRDCVSWSRAALQGRCQC